MVRRGTVWRAIRGDRVHARAVLLASLAIAAAQLLDLVTFVVMIRAHGLAAEVNPVVGAGGATVGVAGLALAKAALVLLLVSGIVLLRHGPWGDHPRLAGLVAVLGIASGMVGGVSNVLAI
jgi:hypothetical protein